MESDPSRTFRSSLAIWMTVLGFFAIWVGASHILRRWSYLVLGARVCDVAIVTSGALLLCAGLWHGLTRGKQRAAAGLGSLAAGIFALTLFAGVLTGAIPCSGPS
jgi:hypothetical protein